ncbi:MAG: NAD-dependent epimerase/dehydratase family protein, partial [Gemmatimonadota bacterium]
MPVSAQALFDWHERPGAFDRLTPAWMPVELRHREGGIRDSARVTIALPMGPFTIPWTLGHTGYKAGEEFRDIQIRGPFRRWEHIHRMEPVSDHASVLDDRINFALPVPPFGDLVAGWYTRSELMRLLQWRHTLTRNDLDRHARFTARGPRTIAITGASGMVGSALVPFLTTGGHTVRTIGRGSSSAVRWDPARGQLDPASLDGVDAVVHLAGENVGARWTAARRRAIVDSRLQGTRLIAESVAKMTRKPEVLV